MQKWEYAVAIVGVNDIQEDMNAAGEKGWDVINVLEATDAPKEKGLIVRILYKRPKL
jgi:hypothetical protein